MTILSASCSDRKPLLSSFLDLVRPDLSAAELGASLGASRSHAHGLVQRLERALTPRPPGPEVGSEDVNEFETVMERSLGKVYVAELVITVGGLMLTETGGRACLGGP